MPGRAIAGPQCAARRAYARILGRGHEIIRVSFAPRLAPQARGKNRNDLVGAVPGRRSGTLPQRALAPAARTKARLAPRLNGLSLGVPGVMHFPAPGQKPPSAPRG